MIEINKILPRPYFFKNGRLFCETVDIEQVARKFGTPLYLYSERAIVESFMEIKNVTNKWPIDICYAVKANSTLSVLKLLGSLDSGFDVVSQGELLRVIKSVKNPKKIVFSGVGKTDEELKVALEANIFCINVESLSELCLIDRIANNLHVKAPISIRVNPDIDAKTHPYIATGLKENKFGLSFSEAKNAYTLASQLNSIKIIGIDCHIGSQITEISPYVESTKKILNFVDSIKEFPKKNFHFDLGGGLGICYKNESPPTPQKFFTPILSTIESWASRKSISMPRVIFELGRSVVGPSGILISKILALKSSEDSQGKNFMIVDAAMNDLLRPSLYNAYHHIFKLNQTSYEGKEKKWDIVGPVCETGDWLGKDRLMDPKEGDLIGLASAGAYGSSMTSNYNSRRKPAEVMIRQNGGVDLIKIRESFDDLISKEV